MSHHRYVDEAKQVTVLIGWESVKRNLVTHDLVGGGFFMVVYDATAPEATSDRPAFSNLHQPDPYPTALEPYLQHLEDGWGVTLPAELMDQLEEDRVNNQ